MAKVMALYNLREEKDQRRDFFPALLASMKLKDHTVEDVLSYRYKLDKSVMITDYDPDLDGAQGGETLKANLQRMSNGR